MTTKQKILELLRGRSTILSGEEMASELNISRTAVWKAIRELEKIGYQIEHHAKGYRYLTSDVLEKEKIASSYLLADNIIIKKEVTSTMNEAKLAALKQPATPALFVAEKQTGGHGRFGRPFFSPSGQIYMTLLLTANQTFAELPQYTILAAVAISLAIDQLTGTQTQIKWVNDIYLKSKKICGILSEATSDFESGQIKHITIGCGINFSIKTTEFPADLSTKAGSIFPKGEPAITRNDLIHLIWQYFFELLEALPDKTYLEIYRKKSFVLGRQVQFTQQKVNYTGLAQDISDSGELIVKTDQGIKKLSSGEISLKAIGE
ncbi:MAG TPA: biotin--[acetyl-CoA-carboxylase] ligase [Tetragenococcus sp.]|nr:biotin--[acetyl-CoA-carboxylase] ligase [Tetragenococcus sp.]